MKSSDASIRIKALEDAAEAAQLVPTTVNLFDSPEEARAAALTKELIVGVILGLRNEPR